MSKFIKLEGALVPKKGSFTTAGAGAYIIPEETLIELDDHTGDYFAMTTGSYTGQTVLFYDTAETSGIIFNHDTGTPTTGYTNFYLNGLIDITLTHGDSIMFIYDGTYWREIFRNIIANP